MGGKSIYIKQIAIMQVMAQVCFEKKNHKKYLKVKILNKQLNFLFYFS